MFLGEYGDSAAAAPQPLPNSDPIFPMPGAESSPWAMNFASFKAAIAPYLGNNLVWSNPNGAGPQLPLLTGKMWQPSGAASGIVYHPVGEVLYRMDGIGQNISQVPYAINATEHWVVSGDMSRLLGQEGTDQHVSVTYVQSDNLLVPVSEPSTWHWSSNPLLPKILLIAGVMIGAGYVAQLVGSVGVESAAATVTDSGVISSGAVSAAVDTGAITAADAAAVYPTAIATDVAGVQSAVETSLYAQGASSFELPSLTAGGAFTTSAELSAQVDSAMAAYSGMTESVATGLAEAAPELAPSVADGASKIAINTAMNGGNVAKAVGGYLSSVIPGGTNLGQLASLAATLAGTVIKSKPGTSFPVKTTPAGSQFVPPQNMQSLQPGYSQQPAGSGSVALLIAAGIAAMSLLQ